jgi:uncharacterized membrane protein YphA (DoxX/SURF4 family)
MNYLVIAIQLIIALGILNVWLVRSRWATGYRGGDAKNLKEEFEVYGLPRWFMGVVGFFKILFAVMLIAGIWVPTLTKPAAVGMAVLMLGAVSMHIKVKDPIKKGVPATSLFVLCLVVALV